MSPNGESRQSIVLVTGPSGAGRSTALNALEDLGFETIDNLPISLVPRLLEGPALNSPLALGLDIRNRDFSPQLVTELLEQLADMSAVDAHLLYLDANTDTLIRRYSETRRRHPLSPDNSPRDGILQELGLLEPLKSEADILIETSGLSPHDLRAELVRWFTDEEAGYLAVTVESFSYKRGLPRGADLVWDCRFLNNPHWVAELRGLTGQTLEVADYVAGDERYTPFLEKLTEMVDFLLPAFRAEGKAHLGLALGCTGGKHRSVAVAEALGKALANKGWQVSIRHRELERLPAGDGTAQ